MIAVFVIWKTIFRAVTNIIQRKRKNVRRKILMIGLVAIMTSVTFAQRTTFTGTVVIYGSGRNTRTVTAPFTLYIDGQTSPAEAQRLLGVLQERGQRGLLDAMQRSSDLGRLSIGRG